MQSSFKQPLFIPGIKIVGSGYLWIFEQKSANVQQFFLGLKTSSTDFLDNESFSFEVILTEHIPWVRPIVMINIRSWCQCLDDYLIRTKT